MLAPPLRVDFLEVSSVGSCLINTSCSQFTIFAESAFDDRRRRFPNFLFLDGDEEVRINIGPRGSELSLKADTASLFPRDLKMVDHSDNQTTAGTRKQSRQGGTSSAQVRCSMSLPSVP